MDGRGIGRRRRDAPAVAHCARRRHRNGEEAPRGGEGRALKSQNWNTLEEALKSTEDFLDGVPDAEKAPVMKELEALRKEALPKIAAVKSKNIVDRITRDIDSAADQANRTPDGAMSAIKDINEKLAADDTKKYVDPATLQKLQARVAGIQQMAVKGVKKRVTENAKPLIEELEKQVADNPFKDKQQNEAYSLSQSLDSEIKRIRGIYDALPKDDPDVKAMNAKLDGIAKKIDAYGSDSDKAEVIARMTDYWANTRNYFDGLADRDRRSDVGPLHEGIVVRHVGHADAQDRRGDQSDEVLVRQRGREEVGLHLPRRPEAEGDRRRGAEDARHGVREDERQLQQAARRGRKAADAEQE